LRKDNQAGSPPVVGLLAEFDSVEGLVAAARAVSRAGYREWDAHTPFPVHALTGLMRKKVTRLRLLIFLCGAAGAALALLLQWFTNAVHYPYLVSGKPLFSLPANIPVTFELTVLFAAFATFFGMLALNGLPRFFHPAFLSQRFRRATADRFFVTVEARDAQFDLAGTSAFLESLGAVSIEALTGPAEAAYQMPRWVNLALAVVGVVALVPLTQIALARAKTGAAPPLRLVPDMVNQPKYKPQAESRIFADGRAMRLPVPGTVAQGELQDDDHFYRGKVKGQWATTFPLPVTDKLLRRGQERYNIYCATCHGLAGYGDGITAKRAEELEQGTWVPPSSYHTDTVRGRPVGHLFNTITNGIRNMPPYGSQIPVEDRWAIVAYIRALQRSQAATLKEVPPEARARLSQDSGGQG